MTTPTIVLRARNDRPVITRTLAALARQTVQSRLIVFDFIRPDVAKLIVAKMLGQILERVRETQGVEVRFSGAARQQIEDMCLAPKVLALGGRQIAKTLEGRLVTPLAERLFDSVGTEIQVTGIEDAGIVLDDA